MTEALTSAVGRKNIQLYVVMYVNRLGLGDVLEYSRVCTRGEWDAFVHGFNQASPLFSIVDVGYGKEAADAKLRGECRLLLSNGTTF